jgi:hypothetical protein
VLIDHPSKLMKELKDLPNITQDTIDGVLASIAQI